MEKIALHFFHGFLGNPSDWSAVVAELRTRFPQEFENDRIAVHLWNLNDPAIREFDGMRSWAEAQVQNFHSGLQIENAAKSQRNILIGYSMGGRAVLSLAEVLLPVSQLNHFVLVSAGLGIPNSEKAQRIFNDQKWADKFRKESWNSVLQDWNQQAVFQGGAQEPERKESDYAIEMIDYQLTKWSLAHQHQLNEMVLNHADRFSIVLGEKDPKYRKMYEGFKVEIAEGSGHRVLFDNPQAIAEAVVQAIRN